MLGPGGRLDNHKRVKVTTMGQARSGSLTNDRGCPSRNTAQQRELEGADGASRRKPEDGREMPHASGHGQHWLGGSMLGETSDALLGRADDALYVAKKEARNRMRVATQ